ncbi:MAG: hypothetical protein KatS3mg035_2287 [Bacteroidia bacterium]|nr:MAG: hypothetical protein KatS3mg035_2287 [Bacteroidia bacterium]
MKNFKYKANFVVCGYLDILYPVAILKFNQKREVADFVQKYEVCCDVLEVFRGEEKIFYGSIKEFLSSEIE